MQLFIRGQELKVVECEENETIGNIKVRVNNGIPLDQIHLYCEGEPLDDETLVGSLSCGELDMNIGLLGGKVHGSLARAGKVKGQTPKVEKQEKKKKKTGRAKRRFQYNRRFVNIVQSFGRKRGPNAAPVT